jgi:hypothetical protein
MFAQLSSQPPAHRMERLPNWISRRQRTQRPAAVVVRGLPSGAVIARATSGATA